MVQKGMCRNIFHLCITKTAKCDHLPLMHRTVCVDAHAEYNARYIGIHAHEYLTKLGLRRTIFHVHGGTVRRDRVYRTHLLYPKILALRMGRDTLPQPTRPTDDMHSGGGGHVYHSFYYFSKSIPSAHTHCRTEVAMLSTAFNMEYRRRVSPILATMSSSA